MLPPPPPLWPPPPLSHVRLCVAEINIKHQLQDRRPSIDRPDLAELVALAAAAALAAVCYCGTPTPSICKWEEEEEVTFGAANFGSATFKLDCLSGWSCCTGLTASPAWFGRPMWAGQTKLFGQGNPNSLLASSIQFKLNWIEFITWTERAKIITRAQPLVLVVAIGAQMEEQADDDDDDEGV